MSVTKQGESVNGLAQRASISLKKMRNSTFHLKKCDIRKTATSIRCSPLVRQKSIPACDADDARKLWLTINYIKLLVALVTDIGTRMSSETGKFSTS